MSIAESVSKSLAASSWIRKMFEEGARLKAEYGPENVFDFSLGNPNVPPPAAFKQALAETAADTAIDHSYMPNTGYPETRAAVAAQVSKEQAATLSASDIIMTCGAAGGLNVILKAILNPGEMVVTPAPFFVEYKFYALNHGGEFATAPVKADFDLDLDALDRAIGNTTRAVIINSPNNPTGAVYPKETLARLGILLSEKSAAFNRTIYLIADEPYRKIVYDNMDVPPVFAAYADSLIVTSYSKDLSLPGERIGFIAVNPAAQFKEDLLGAMAFANRVLGFVNAPALMQRVVAKTQGQQVDISEYARKRELICDILSDCGYAFTRPMGAFYLFPSSPTPDDVEFVRILQDERILAVPGSGFGGPGYFRLSFCVDDDTIKNAAGGFQTAMDKTKQ
ncbi:MAG: pyridoxal phosphate-dependent aminotransferase [Thermodesulfobacteriota bacterium]|nr:pyridoxal phosphate-dependent aminotransferase [Thermodesulfobacteriota bacterium]